MGLTSPFADQLCARAKCNAPGLRDIGIGLQRISERVKLAFGGSTMPAEGSLLDLPGDPKFK